MAGVQGWVTGQRSQTAQMHAAEEGVGEERAAQDFPGAVMMSFVPEGQTGW